MPPEKADQLCYLIEHEAGVVSYAELDSMKESMMEYPADLRLRVLAVLKKTGRQ